MPYNSDKTDLFVTLQLRGKLLSRTLHYFHGFKVCMRRVMLMQIISSYLNLFLHV